MNPPLQLQALTKLTLSITFPFSFSQNSNSISTSDLPFPTKSLCSITFSKEDIYEALVSLDPTKGMGGDYIPPIVIKQCAASLLDPVHYIFTQYMCQSSLPIEWRSHNITPNPKTKDKTSVKRYWPISLLCCLPKVLERLIFNKIHDFTADNIISYHQFHFMRNQSTVKQLLLSTEYFQFS